MSHVRSSKFERVDEKVSTQKQPSPSTWLSWLLPLLIFLLTVVVFFPALQNGFVNWDDDENLLGNPSYRGLGWPQLRWMFTTFHFANYRPLTWTTLGLDYLLWGMNPFGYHLTSVLLHAANAVLFYFVALGLLGFALSGSNAHREFPLQVAAGFSALIFAFHPLRVEPVAWVSARNHVLSGLFYLLTILCYLRAAVYVKRNSLRWCWLTAAVIIYGLSLLSQPSGITLPFVLLVLDIYPIRRLGGGPGEWFGSAARKVWWEKVPFLSLAVGAGVIALLARHQANALASIKDYGLIFRLPQSLFGLAFYLWKTIIPLGLSPLYELPIDFNPWDWRFLLSGLVVLGVSIGLFVARHRWPAGLASWVCYVVILSPVLGITQSGPQIVADRYSYLSCLGWAILAGAGLFYCWQGWLRGAARAVVPALGLVGIVVLGVLTWKQAHVWHDSIRLWEHAVAITEDSYFKSSIAHGNLGVALVSRGELKKAVQHYRDALRIDPANAEAHNNLGVALLEQGGVGEAIEHYREALRINPAYAEAHYNLGNVLVRRGEIDEAVEHYHAALRTRPADAKAHYNLGTILARKGQLEEAIQHFRQALEIDPAYAMAHYNLGTALAIRGDLEGAIDHFQQALRLNPSSSEMQFGLGNVLATRGDLEEAVVHLRRAVRIQPDFAEAHEGLGRALAQQGKREEAVKHYQEALRIMKSRQEVGALK